MTCANFILSPPCEGTASGPNYKRCLTDWRSIRAPNCSSALTTWLSPAPIRCRRPKPSYRLLQSEWP